MRTNLQIKVGTYTGDGNDSRNITGIGFIPDLVIVKGGANVSCIRTKEMIGDTSISMASSVAATTDQIQELLNDGFQVGTSAVVNANGTVYFYIAIRGSSAQQYFRTGRYTGNSTDNRDFTTGGINFTPDLVAVFCNTTQAKVWRSSSIVGDLSAFFSSNALAANEIQNLQSNGFQVGNAGEVNSSGIEHFFFALKVLSGVIAVGTYTGDGIDGRTISGVGFQPDMIIVKRDGASQARLLTKDMTADNSANMGSSAATADGIQSITTDGFTVGANASVNTNGTNYYWIALKDGNFNTPLNRLTI